MTTRLPHRICGETTRIMREMYAKFPHISPDTPKDVTIYAVDQRRGRAYYEKRMVTIPLWIFERPRGEGYAIWYMAHELAHIADYDAGNKNGNHGPGFMAQLKKLCPAQYQHFELNYKPRNAAAAGIRR